MFDIYVESVDKIQNILNPNWFIFELNLIDNDRNCMLSNILQKGRG
jgi:hypothetical protein